MLRVRQTYTRCQAADIFPSASDSVQTRPTRSNAVREVRLDTHEKRLLSEHWATAESPVPSRRPGGELPGPGGCEHAVKRDLTPQRLSQRDPGGRVERHLPQLFGPCDSIPFAGSKRPQGANRGYGCRARTVRRQTL